MSKKIILSLIAFFALSSVVVAKSNFNGATSIHKNNQTVHTMYNTNDDHNVNEHDDEVNEHNEKH